MMSKETAKKAVDIAMSCPTPCISIEFQGGEPLINFEVIKYIVEYADQMAIEKNKTVEYNLVSNLTLLTDEIIDYIRQHNIGVSTSIDGDKCLIYKGVLDTIFDSSFSSGNSASGKNLM